MKIPYGRQTIDQDDIDNLVRTLQSDFLTQGPKVTEFEEKFASYVGAKYAVAVSNATMGLHISVLAMGLQKGDRIITTPITFAASANCARFVGAEVWLTDINPDTYLIDIESTRKLIESKPKGFFKGIIPVDFAGLPVNLEEFKELADEHGLWIVEDACHAPGGYFTNSKGEKVKCGSNVYSDCAVFSFHPVKHIACGEGGMVTTNSEEVYKKLSLLRTHGITKENMRNNDGDWYYEMQILGYNYRMNDIQASLGITQLAKNDIGLDRRNEIAKKYDLAFQGKSIKSQSLYKGAYNAHHLYVIEIDNRKELYEYLKESGIFAQIHYIPIHYLPYYKNIGYGDAELGNSEHYYDRCLSLPMYPGLTDQEQEYVIEKVLNFLAN
ncbi:UDP-4-amino-4,6-dideoxy-N-acetyl-beta-L-altrosamine transaminase [Riemerella anatipestifer]|nr:UDP-4-amino-4,6-dideoxy-N-acetyl-beta-L-altrosamine transaminase [Riemerella anatipestifer]